MQHVNIKHTGLIRIDNGFLKLFGLKTFYQAYNRTPFTSQLLTLFHSHFILILFISLISEHLLAPKQCQFQAQFINT